MQIRKMPKKIQKKCFVYEINASEIFFFHLSLLLREYVSLAVNVLRKGL